MLSPHEFTTLMLLNDAPDRIETDRDEFHALLEQHLVALDPVALGPRITAEGRAVLKAFARMR
ncbi:hypothetical protein LIG30_3462 [Burkholderia sp. lig30]|jgi:hypothetical protein|uniref:hypothetical protein n=1 Tax=Burkholderia sp. lig30 TaxID=1192124 RepID=UPI000460D88D|nr:hypothetical protein [Burkholderia sp. lig30]KDB07216.1 hypothetical protein LIG30_3462 [Burkholderia sp. lig30]